VLTPRSETELNTPRARELKDWIGGIGAFTVTLEAEEHD
jgi:prephenate dehydrogenase